MSIKSEFCKILSPQAKSRLANVYYNAKRILKIKGKIITKCEYKLLSYPKKHCFFGYYDITPYNNHNDFIYLVLNERGDADVYIKRATDKESVLLTSSKAWNWQQGCRLRWLPGSEGKIIFNDFCDNTYCSRIINVVDNNEDRINYPLYDINKDGTRGLSLNFERLGVMRPGYGYVNRKYVADLSNLPNEGIDEIDLKNNTKVRLFSYSDISFALGSKASDYKNNYINHISYSPSCEKFLFFWITVENNYHKALLMVYDLKTKKIIPLETENKVSHYVWIDDNYILCTIYDSKKKCRYQIYGLDGSIKEVFPQLNFDGHPIMIDDDTIVTDSYPDQESYQHLYFCSLKNQVVSKFFDIYAWSTETVEKRTDLHPRYNNALNKVVIDCNKDGIREMCLIDISSLL